MRMLKFIAATLLTSDFWCLFLACFTIFWMLAWRGALQDSIFKSAQESRGRRWYA